MPRTTPIELLHLHRDDNVAILPTSAKAGAVLGFAEMRFALHSDLEMGHKIAIRPISAGSDILKYGLPIGMAAKDIAPGDHVHLNNIRSRYTEIEDMETPRP